jgi:DNA-directed RNA polymerase subunit H (RpoH/RPB5)
MDELNENNIQITIKILCEMLNDRGYNVETIENINIEEIKIQLENKILDFEAKHNKKNEKIHIKYLFNKPKPVDIHNIITNWVNNEEEFSKNDKYIIILKESSLTIDKKIIEAKESFEFNIQIFLFNKLLRNITKHEYQPKFNLVDESEEKEILQQYSLKSKSKLPWININDPISQYFGLVPGNIIKITRFSETSGEYITYRYCH